MSDENSYVGKNITIHFDGQKCIYSRNCVLNEPNVFLANVDGDWIQPDNASVHALIALAHNCPSGAITYSGVPEEELEAPPQVNKIHIRENGPLAIEADMQFPDAKAGTRATLCRCGASKNKPFCDGNHKAAGFEG